MKKHLLTFSALLIVFGKLLCHWVFTLNSPETVTLRHIYYMSDFIAHVTFMFAIYVNGFKKEYRNTFLFLGVICAVEVVYYSLYMFKICAFDSNIESYSVSIVEFTLTVLYGLNLHFKWLK